MQTLRSALVPLLLCLLTAAAARAVPKTHTVTLGNAAGAKQSLPLIQAAETSWRTAQMPVDLTRATALEVYTQAFPANDGAAALLRVPELLQLAAAIAAESPTEAANARKTAAFVYAKQAKYDEALAQYNAALPLFVGTDDTYNRVVVLENRAKIERIQAHNALALADINAALPLAQQSNDARGELALEVERGAIATASGQLGLAYESDLRAVSLAQTTPSPYLEGIAWSDLAVALTELNDFPGADRALDRADAVWKANQNAYAQLQTREDRAELRLAQGDLAGARSFFAAGAEVAQKNSLAREHAYFLRGLAVAETRAGRFADAQTHLREAMQEAEQAKVNDTLSTIDASLGDLNALQHRWTEAAADWERADKLALQAGSPFDHVIALSGLVRAAVQAGQLPLAGERCRQAMDALESIRGGISDSELRLSFFSSRHALYDLCVQTALRHKDQQAAFDAAERGRARSLLDQVAAAGVQTEISGDAPEGLAARLRENGNKLVAARKALASTAKPGGDAHSRKTVADLLQVRDDLRRQAEDSGLSGRLAAESLPLSQQEIVARLDSSTALLAYWLAPGGSVAWLVTSRGVSTFTLPPARALEESTRGYLDALLAPLTIAESASAEDRAHALASVRASALQQGLALRRTLLPMQFPPQIKRLLIVKDGAILPVSFSALPLEDGAYLGSRFALATEPSAAMAWRPSRPSPPFPQMRSVVFADPAEKGTADPPPHALSRTAWTAPLPFARGESEVLQQTFGERNTRVFAGPSATRTNALSLDWSQFDVAHFATHAVFRKTHPELSGLVLASPGNSGPAGVPEGDGGGPAKDSLLSFYDVLQIKAPLQLVVLNACNSGSGKLLPGEGKLALDNAFLAAGASRVIATLWPVDDEAGSVFMQAFYRSLARTRSPMLSLKEAQEKMVQTAQWSAPYYWGAFTLTGDWRPFSIHAAAGSAERAALTQSQ